MKSPPAVAFATIMGIDGNTFQHESAPGQKQPNKEIFWTSILSLLKALYIVLLLTVLPRTSEQVVEGAGGRGRSPQGITPR